ncbi:MAG: right-handed parallel beta-helix repeat-containing protein [Planctomycetota bacterium]
MGYHYGGDILRYVLTISYVDANGVPIDPLLAHGSVVPNPDMASYIEDSIVRLTATPDPGFRVATWYGTDNDSSPKWANTVTMTSDKHVAVAFERTNTLKVPMVYKTIEEAVADAGYGDKIVLEKEQVYEVNSPDGIDFGGKKLTLTSENPADPNCVATTIIDCSADRYTRRRAFYFHSGEGPDTIITGVTIRNGYQRGIAAQSGRFGVPTPSPYEYLDYENVCSPVRAERGQDSPVSHGYGGAILCVGASPTIRNCVITDCIVTGGQGGDGAPGMSGWYGEWCYVPPFEECEDLACVCDGQWGGHAGVGRGNGYGGAIACLEGSHPVIINCTIKNNTARGGRGGDGGNGGDACVWPDFTDGYESGSGSGGDGIGDGFGGGIYCENGSGARLIDCNFVNNTAGQGWGGDEGDRGQGNLYSIPDNPPPQPLDGIEGSSLPSFLPAGLIAGGAAYYGAGVEPNVTNCRFIDNRSGVTDPNILIPLFDNTYTRGGGMYSGPFNTVALRQCTFRGNLGGGLYCEPNSIAAADKCLFRDNFISYSGGAICAGAGCLIDVNDSSFFGNSAVSNGGALGCDGDLYLRNSLFGGNESGDRGGAISADGFARDITLIVDINTCIFAGNHSDVLGGAINLKGFNANVVDSYFIYNTAPSAGGLALVHGTLNLNRAYIHANTALGGSSPGRGGGVVCSNTDAIIENCTIRDNVADSNSEGGGILFYAAEALTTHLVKNCLLVDNSAGLGGAVACMIDTVPEIQNCTFSGNSASRLGGAIHCDWSSSVQAIYSIFSDCNNHAICEEDAGGAVVTNSMFHNNPDGDYGLYDFRTGQTQTSTGPDLDATNVDDDPNFVSGPFSHYYLDQAVSPAVDRGPAQAGDFGMDIYTTDPNGSLDTGLLDWGYHYKDHLGTPLYELTFSVVANTGGTVGPTSPEPITYDDVNNVYTYYAGTPVTVVAEPETNYMVRGWTGTINDASKAVINTSIMLGDRHVRVEFGQPRFLVVSSQGPYTTIQHAVDDADDGDIVFLESGTYTPAHLHGGTIPPITIVNKGITLTSETPDDPNGVYGAVLDGYVIRISSTIPAVTRTIIDGITFTGTVWGGGGRIHSWGQSPIIRNCVFRDLTWYGHWGVTPSGFDGTNGESVFGGAIAVYGGHADIQNCVFRNCAIVGGTGGQGDDGDPYGHDGGWAGKAYGGAIYIDSSANATVVDCSFINCTAQGGDGGDGGNGSGPHGGRGGNWEWAPSIETGPYTVPHWSWWNGWQWGPYDEDGNPRPYIYLIDEYGYYEDYWKYSGYGGAIYCASRGSSQFIDCEFERSRSYGGVCGIGGEPWRTPNRNLNIENFGGAVYVTDGRPEFVNCSFVDCLADTSFDPCTVVGANVPDDYYISYGGAVALEDVVQAEFVNCTVSSSEACIGGGIWWSDTDATITDCNILGNTAYSGAGAYSIYSSGQVTNCAFSGNRAFGIPAVDTNDANLVFHPSVVLGRGGGYYCFSSLVDITDSVFTGNRASASGGGLYFGGSDLEVYFWPTMHNCLVTRNSAGRDGGGVSSNWFAEPTISNCTIADNRVTGLYGYGGGLYSSYNSAVEVIDSIIWDNISPYRGSQIAVATNFKYEPRPSTVGVTYSDIGGDPEVPTALDLVFCIDTTASMTWVIDAVKESAKEIVEAIGDTLPDYRIAVVDYRDFNQPPYGAPTVDYPYNDVLPFETDLDTILDAIDSITLGAGADWPESVFAALMHCIDHEAVADLIDPNRDPNFHRYGADANSVGPGQWRTGDNVARVVLLIGDAFPHDPEPFTGYTTSDILRAAIEEPAPKRIFSIVTGFGVGEPIVESYFRSLSEGTEGAMLAATGASQLVDAIMHSVMMLTRVAPPIWVYPGATLEGWHADTNSWDADTYNIGEDPNFSLAYYLSNIPAGQDVNSPCIDAGSAPPDDPNIRLETYTTSTDGAYDVNIVDMGYHYKVGLPKYNLTVDIVDAAGNVVDPCVGHGSVSPRSGQFYAGQPVLLTADPCDGYRVAKWTGTDNDSSTSWQNTVTMTGDQYVTVSFELTPMYHLYVFIADGNGTVEPNFGVYPDRTTIELRTYPDPNFEVKRWVGTDDDTTREPNNTVTIDGGDAVVHVWFGLLGGNDIYILRDPNTLYPTIQDAIDAAVYEGDVVVVCDGVFTGPGNYDLHFNGIPITVRSKDGPDNCIIDCRSAGRGFIFQGYLDPDDPDPNTAFTPEDPNYIVRGFTITGGYADLGGALYYDSNSAPLVEDCIITGNTATDEGGGVYFQNTGVAFDPEAEEEPNFAVTPKLVGCKITNNYSYWNGGGISCMSASPMIINTEIVGNTATIFGGGFYGGEESAGQILNCLITDNTSGHIGGAIYLRDSSPTIRFCTIAYNLGAEIEPRDGIWWYPVGGIACRDAEPTIDHCIIGRNSGYWARYYGVWGDWTRGDDLYECEATNSDIEDGDEGDGNISLDPKWVTGGLGDFYLSQIPYQPDDSPCVDAGDMYILVDLQELYDELAEVTTCIINQPDGGIADMGYHYPYFDGPPIRYTLTIRVIGNGSVKYRDPNYVLVDVNEATSPAFDTYSPGGWVTLTAVPDEGYRVLEWTGTDNDDSFSVYNSVSMYRDRVVTVQFEPAVSHTINVVARGPGGEGTYVGIQLALDAARDGDTLLLASGIYSGTGFTLLGKNVTIASLKPAEPCSVAATIIDCDGEISGGLHILGTPGGRSVLNGVTIINARTVFLPPEEPEDPGMRGYDGGDNLARGWMYTYEGTFTGEGYFYSDSALSVVGNHLVVNCIIRDCSVTGGDASNGTDGDQDFMEGGDGGDGGDAGGAGIYVGDFFGQDYVTDPNGSGRVVSFNWGSSPTFINCTVENCTATAGSGANGAVGGQYADGGDGGVAGRALGGGIYCDVTTRPTFINCTVRNCGTVGGLGGNGGDGGSNGGYGGYGGLTVYDVNQGDPWTYTANGAGVFCDVFCEPNFVDCKFIDNVCDGSISGVGGFSNPGNVQNQPRKNYHIPSFGGAVYCDSATSSRFENCTVRGNEAAYYGSLYTGYGGGICLDGARTELQPEYDYYGGRYGPGDYHGLPYDGIYALGMSWATLTDCNITNNSASVGGGFYAISLDVNVVNCSFAENASYVGGGLASFDSLADVYACTIRDNIASQSARAWEPVAPNEPNAPPEPNEPNLADTLQELYEPVGIIYGAGAGYYCFTTDALIKDCVVTENITNGSGGGIYLGGQTRPASPEVNNCLITRNRAALDGGGLSANWYWKGLVSNCTIADNIVTDPNAEGGGLYCSYDSNMYVLDSIIWGNRGGNGAQVAVGNGGLDYPMPSVVTIVNSDVGPPQEPSEFALSGAGSSGSSSPQGGGTVLVDADAIYDQFDAGQQKVKVIVGLLEPPTKTTTNWDSPQSVGLLRAEIADRQSTVLSSVTCDECAVQHLLENQAAFSAEVTRQGLDKLLSDPLVASIEPVRYARPMLAQEIPLANALQARDHYNGEGMAIAIVDSGVDYTHPMLGAGGFPNSKVIGGYDFGDLDPDPMPVPGDPASDTAHGTCCAGIAAGDLGDVGDYIGGVAYGAKIYALKVSPLDAPNSIPLDAALAAWDWCITHRYDNPQNPIMVISNSWGMDGLPFDNSGQADDYSPAFATSAKTAVEAGITIVAAAGNDGFAGQGISWPAAMSNVISVGAVHDSVYYSTNCLEMVYADKVTCYSNTADILDILAPAELAYTTDMVGGNGYHVGNYYPYFAGTSSACPFAAGIVANLQSAALAKFGTYLVPDEVKQVLVRTGKPVTDTKVVITKPRVDLGAAVAGLAYGPPIYVEKYAILNGWEAPDSNNYWHWDTGLWDANVIEEDPNFASGYYLSHIDTGHDINSACIDRGSRSAEDAGLHTYTTRIDGANDVCEVDLGYHYRDGLASYTLTADVVDSDGNVVDPFVGHGSVAPSGGLYFAGEVVVLTADPCEGYRVRKWRGTDNDLSKELTNTVTMTRNRRVTVEFEIAPVHKLTTMVFGGCGTIGPPTGTYEEGLITLEATPCPGYRVKKWVGTDDDTSTEPNNTVTLVEDKVVIVMFEQPTTLLVPGQYSSIQEAWDAAKNGDKILVSPGTYVTTNGYTLYDKDVVISGTDPADPCVVAGTVIRLDVGEGGYVGRAFNFINVGPETVLQGITIKGFHYRGLNGDEYTIVGEESVLSGKNGSPVLGGAILCAMASPTFRNCVITDCNITGGNGSNGEAGTATDPNGGHGGWPGFAYGGGVACLLESDPCFTNCVFRNCFATGGNGGDGGDGAGPYGQGGKGGGWHYTESIFWPYGYHLEDLLDIEAEDSAFYGGGDGTYDAYNKYTGLGGAAYIGPQCAPTFTGCTFINNASYGGNCGITGLDAMYGLRGEPSIRWKIDNFGGAVYCDTNSAPLFVDCDFSNNVADPNYPPNNDRPFVSRGGAVAVGEGANPAFEGCVFELNRAGLGGGMYLTAAGASVDDCDFEENSAYQGGGLYCVDSSAVSITGCSIRFNKAPAQAFEPNDPNRDPNDPVNWIVGQGGGIYFSASPALIRDCLLGYNFANTSGGGMYLTGSGGSPLVKNCLFVGNLAGRDGGGASVNWDVESLIRNCTFVGNAAIGSFGQQGYTGFGGGIYAGYNSDSEVIDCIFWNDYALEGGEIAVGTAFEYGDVWSSILTVSFSDVDGGRAATLVDDENCELVWGPGNINSDPLFVTGPLGNYYLSQTVAGQAKNSPCVNTGSDDAGILGMTERTTRTDEIFDILRVDMGYHYLLSETFEPCKRCDLFRDGIVEFYDLAEFALEWLNQSCSGGNAWCGGADLTFSTRVDFEDYAYFAGCWLVEDTEPPIPDPARWEIAPHSKGAGPSYSISMTVREAYDAWDWDVEYYFECLTDAGHDSGWRTGRTYELDSLARGTELCFRVRARDSNPVIPDDGTGEPGLKTGWSEVRCALAGGPIVPDTNEPAPYPYIKGVHAIASNSVRVESTVAYDISSVEYYFDCTAGGGHDSGWQDEPTYIDDYLVPETTYCYRVMARDKSPNQNATPWSDADCNTTGPHPDVTAPTPDRMEWDMTEDANGFTGLPRVVYLDPGEGQFGYGATMRASPDTADESGFEFFFDCLQESQYDSGWIRFDAPPYIYSVVIGGPEVAVTFSFRVKARDLSPNQNETAWSTEELPPPSPW